jgi:PleD family two-component response regulator
MTAIIIDAANSMRDTIANLLKSIGFAKVVQSTNGEHAMSTLNHHKVDLIICNQELPKLDGLELLKQVRQSRKNSETPFIMTSSQIEQSKVVQAIEGGVSEYVVKPFSGKILVARINRALDSVNKGESQLKPMPDIASSQVSEPLRILVVDDVPDNIQVISDILRKDYRVKAATNGAKALKICGADPQPDLVLLDVMMPEMDGFEVCQRLKKDPLTAHISVIFLTALEQTQNIVKGLEMGAIDYINKPINPPIVKARVATHANLINSVKSMRNQIDTLRVNIALRHALERFSEPVKEIDQAVIDMEHNFDDEVKLKENISHAKKSCGELSETIDNMLAISRAAQAKQYTPKSK